MYFIIQADLANGVVSVKTRRRPKVKDSGMEAGAGAPAGAPRITTICTLPECQKKGHTVATCMRNSEVYFLSFFSLSLNFSSFSNMHPRKRLLKKTEQGVSKQQQVQTRAGGAGGGSRVKAHCCGQTARQRHPRGFSPSCQGLSFAFLHCYDTSCFGAARDGHNRCIGVCKILFFQSSILSIYQFIFLPPIKLLFI